MKKAIVLTVLILIVLVLVGHHYTRSDGRRKRALPEDEVIDQPSTNRETNTTDGDSQRENKGETQPAPKPFLEQNRQATGAIRSRIGGEILKDKIQLLLGKKIRDNVPQIEIRFRQRKEGGSLKPVLIENYSLELADPEADPKPFDPKGVHAELAMTADDRGAYGIRIAVVPDDYSIECGAYPLRFGRIYKLRFFRPWNTTKLIKVPKKIEKGQVYVYTVLVDVNDKMPEQPAPPKGPKISGSVTSPTPFPSKDWWIVYRTEGDDPYTADIAADGTFSFHVDQLGGDLLVWRRAKSVGHAWIFVNNVNGKALNLPQDADIVMTDDKLVSCKLKIPKEHRVFDHGILEVELMVAGDDCLPVGDFKLDKDESAAPYDTIPIQLVPGSFFVKINRKLIGKVTFTKADAGKTIEIQPLQESP